MKANHFQDAALAAARRGWSVFPLHCNSKIPAIKHWEQRATTDETQILQWWPRYSRKNVGIATGASHLVVVDLDTAHGHPPPAEWAGALHGRDVLARLAVQAGQPYPGDTYTVRTPTGGEHLYFRAPAEPELRNTVSRAGWRIDSRAGGGFIIAAGSVRAEGVYRVVRNRPIAPLPEWLIPLLAPPALPEAPRVDDTAPVSEHRKRAYLDAVINRARQAEEGTRHDTLLRAACTLGRLVSGGVLTDSEARAALYTAAFELEEHGFPSREADRVINDGLRYGARYPRQFSDI